MIPFKGRDAERGGNIPASARVQAFERMCLPHLDAAHNLARWLVRDAAQAEDLVQEAYLQAWKSFDGYRGGEPRAWILAIVRNACLSWLRGRGRAAAQAVEFDERLHTEEAAVPEPERARAQQQAGEEVEGALRALPEEFREAIVLRELEGCSYKEIAAATGVPPGTVMSRLARGRARLREILIGQEVAR